MADGATRKVGCQGWAWGDEATASVLASASGSAECCPVSLAPTHYPADSPTPQCSLPDPVLRPVPTDAATTNQPSALSAGQERDYFST